jgi:hypothetical protein
MRATWRATSPAERRLDAAGAGRWSQAGGDRQDLLAGEVIRHQVHERALQLEFYLRLALPGGLVFIAMPPCVTSSQSSP